MECLPIFNKDHVTIDGSPNSLKLIYGYFHRYKTNPTHVALIVMSYYGPNTYLINFTNTSDHHRCRMCLFNCKKTNRNNISLNGDCSDYDYNYRYKEPINISLKLIEENCSKYVTPTICIQFGIIGLKMICNDEKKNTEMIQRFFNLFRNIKIENNNHFDFSEIFYHESMKKNKFNRENMETQYLYCYDYYDKGFYWTGINTYWYSRNVSKKMNSTLGLDR